MEMYNLHWNAIKIKIVLWMHRRMHEIIYENVNSKILAVQAKFWPYRHPVDEAFDFLLCLKVLLKTIGVMTSTKVQNQTIFIALNKTVSKNLTTEKTLNLIIFLLLFFQTDTKYP